MAGAPLNSVVQFGAGGAGSAVAHALVALGAAEIAIIDVDPQRAQALAGRLRAHSGRRLGCATDVDAALATADGLVNTTPVGMAKYPGLPFPADRRQRRHGVSSEARRGGKGSVRRCED